MTTTCSSTQAAAVGAPTSALQLTSVQLARRITLPLHEASISTASPLQKSSAVHDLIAGGIAGMAGIFVGQPFDSIKVRMQMATKGSRGGNAAGNPKLSNPASSSGIRSLYRGVGAPVATAALVNATIFVTYGESTRLYERFVVDSDSSKKQPSFFSRKSIICGGVTGIVSSIILCPTEYIKVVMQTQRSLYRNSFDATKEIFSLCGIRPLYRGFYATCLRQAPGFAIYFSTYDALREISQRRFGHSQQNGNPNWFTLIMSGGIAGACSWGAVYPIDLIKSRIQALPMTASKAEMSVWRVARSVVQQGGWGAMYRGIGVTLFRAFPVNGIIFPTYELVRFSLL